MVCGFVIISSPWTFCGFLWTRVEIGFFPSPILDANDTEKKHPFAGLAGVS